MHKRYCTSILEKLDLADDKNKKLSGTPSLNKTKPILAGLASQKKKTAEKVVKAMPEKKSLKEKTSKPKLNEKSIKNCIERLQKGREEKELIKYMKDNGLNNIAAISSRREGLKKQKIVSAPPEREPEEEEKKEERPESKEIAEDKKIPVPRNEEDLILEMNLKFGDNIENIKIYRGDSTEEIAHNVAVNNGKLIN